MSTKRILVGPRHAAAVLGVHENTVRNWVNEGRLTDHRPQGTRFIRLDLVEVTAMRGDTPIGAVGVGRYTHTTQTQIPGYDVFVTITMVPRTGQDTDEVAHEQEGGPSQDRQK